MQFRSLPVFAALLSLAWQTHAQFGPQGGRAGGPPQSPLRGGITKLFGANSAFTANMQMQTKMEGGVISMPGKIHFLDGKSRFEMDASKISGGSMPPGAGEQMKAMGMAEMVSISRPDKKENYIIYPGLKSYAALPLEDTSGTEADGKADLKRTELGKETIDGHPTTKYKVLVKDEEGKDQEVVVWNASDLRDFPVRIQVQSEAGPSTITFSDVKFAKPDETLFTPAADLQRYTDVGTMMREAIMKKFAPGGASPQPKK
jgi:hypothetical protein